MKANDQLYAHVQEIEADLHRTKAAVREAIQARLTVPIGTGLGTVTVTGAGALVSVDVSAKAPWMVGAEKLAAEITRAIRQAEQQARASRLASAAGNGSTR
ncbi:hypothetical protein [Amycolatopsis saalfeldensis]|uniref:YbaB/EbfC DNA-binding family protein n=1 Tax=Amycolatopsis saalfeldensis TaxID=394193 RepID=A0A1H8Y4U6_9PSEU|nr:hypothetical protein [Amycolatopsis saalfeldensis]SEP47129.1 hypothetical protein SAMN04489732_11144 [Amycolatopsis saalfeldensis]